MIFILLKIVEITALIFVPYGAGHILLRYAGKKGGIAPTWFLGWVILAGLGLGGILLSLLIHANWKWTKQIIERFTDGFGD